MRPAIPYYRVSTQAQGQSGLGLEAQKEAVSRFMEQQGFAPILEFTEVESSRKKKRPELEKALAACRKDKATLIIAKLDRLSRNVLFIASLLESKADFIALDNPQANKLMFHMLAAFAEHESDRIRSRIKDALAAAKRKGVTLGKHGKTLALTNQKNADSFAAQVKPILYEIHKEGHTTVRAKVLELNRRNIPSNRRAKWYPNSLTRISKRIISLE
jgi:DNA invertase Pin-like site-specific DNA recombinase